MSPKIANPKESPFNVQMEPYVKEMLKTLSKEMDCSMGQVVRLSIAAQYRHRFANEPHCADCTACRCPAMHTVQPAERVSDEDLVRQMAGQHATD